jgi:putative endonuclease
VYLLRGSKDRKIYTGYTTDLKRRIKDHFSQHVHTTHRMGDLKLIYYEAFTNKKDATEREQYLKTTKGKRTVKLMLKYTLAPIV